MKSSELAQYEHLVASDPVAGLVAIMRQLRDPDSGCPWDLKQTFATIIPHTIEETYEVAEAIAVGEPQHLCEELGDLLFQVVFYAQLGAEKGWFEFADIAQTMCEKLIRRHPHVFGEQTELSPDEVKSQWEAIKASEKKSRPQTVLSSIPNGMTPLMRAQKIQKQCAKVGFDWADIAPVYAKIREELAEVAEAAEHQSHAEVTEEIGDLLFAVVNLARHLDVDAESALIAANQKFTDRFNALESQVQQSGQDITALSLKELDAIWDEVKKRH
ncbi:nucleoside triphosphate pyrophosphohydrolase [Alteromonas sp. LMIT006]|uniref:nucleoside triphosphate pyrophosphohydrolase n=1 Tax=Alteromonadaceae TaxID=72275 RepID=UPI0020CA4635|nr:nucleoside triphosphate pyrophosphohydrolase [Alteromonas sp. LMIT006]UTP73657.1 nucleoside triphosphate pyrophosphohydrolase [Alteromonas sp. LMIT006]